MENIEITEKQLDDFLAYEDVRESGLINMFDVNAGCALSGLTREEYLFCIKHYSLLSEAYQKINID